MDIGNVSLLGEISFRGMSPFVAGALVLLAAVITIVFYMLEIVKVGALPRMAMAGLRILAFVLLGFLLTRPVWVRDVEQERERAVAVLIDNSESLQKADERDTVEDQLRVAIAFDRRDPTLVLDHNPSGSQALNLPEGAPEQPTRAEMVRAVLSNPRLNLQSRLSEIGPVQPFLFGQRVRAISDDNPGEGDWLAALTGTDSQTAMSDAALLMLDRDPDELPTAVVLLTDGQDNASSASFGQLARRCAEVGVPLHIYGTGVSQVGFLRLRSAEVPETLFVEDEVAIPVRWQVRGFDRGTIELSLHLGDKAVGEPKRLTVVEGDDVREVLTFTPTKEDVRGDLRESLEVRIRLIDGARELTDSIRKRVSVEDGKIKVLVIHNTPGWEFKFMQRALLRDRRVEAEFLIIEGDDRMLASGPPFIADFPEKREDFFKYDLLMLGDVPAEFLTQGNRLEWVREFVTDGRGLVAIAGRRHLPADYTRIDEFAEMLPVEFDEERFPIDSGIRSEEFRPALTEAGQRAAMLLMADTREENAELWSDLPGWHWHYPVTKLRPGGVALLAHPDKQIGEDEKKPMPLLAVHNYGRGRVLFAATDETWRWRYNEQERYFGRYWGQVLYSMGFRPERGPRITRLDLSESEPTLGRTGEVFARLMTRDYLPMQTPTVTGRLEKLNPEPGEERYRQVTLEAVEGQPGEYVATMPHDSAGQFTLTVEGAEPASLDYRVSLPPEHELAPGGMAEQELRDLAESSGGAFYREEDLHTLPDALETRTRTFTERREILLWNWPMFALFVGLLGLEWLIRKFRNLS